MAGLFGGGAAAAAAPVAQPVVKMADPKDPVEREETRKRREKALKDEGGGRSETVLSQPPSYSNKTLGG